MSITDELRHNIEGAEQLYGCECKHLLAIADRIDAEHERLCSRSRSNGYSDGFTDGFNDIESWVVDHEDEMAKQGRVRLPKDADDVPWNVGDRDEDGNVVTQLRLSSDGWYAITDGPSAFHPEQRRHYHKPTVEDVLTEFGIDWEHESDCEDRAALLKEYATKLKLAEGED